MMKQVLATRRDMTPYYQMDEEKTGGGYEG